MRFEPFVGLRYLMAKRDRHMLSVITLISVCGVAVGVMALIVVLSVMSGFEGDLREKIIGTKAHIMVSAKEGGYLERYREIGDVIRGVDKVLGASPFVEAEVMLNSPTNLQGVILRGIDVESIDSVSDLSKYMKEGGMEYFDKPDELLSLTFSPREMRSGSLSLQSDDEDGGISDEMKERLEAAGAKAAVSFVGGDHGRWMREGRGNFSDKEEIGQGQGGVVSEVVSEVEDVGVVEEVDGDVWLDEEDEEIWEKGEGCVEGERCLRGRLQRKRSGRVMQAVPGLVEGLGPVEMAGVILGVELKKSLGMYLGGEINIMSPTGDIGPAGGLPKSRPYKVAGSFHSGMYEYDTKMAYISLSSAQMLLNIGDRVSGIDVKIVNFEKSRELVAKLEEALKDYPEVKVEDWRALNGSLFSALMLEKIAMFIILTSIVLVASFSILCLLIMIVIEKGKEIAIFKSMGATNRSIIEIFVIQGGVIGMLGTVIGCILGLLMCWVIGSMGIKPPGEVYYLSQIPVQVNWLEVLLVCVSSVVISLLATVGPSIMAIRLDPVDGLRYE